MTLYTPTQMEKGLRNLFLQEYAAASTGRLVDAIATTVSSGADSEKYGWIGQAPQMVELKDEINYFDVSDTGYTITNKEYAAGMMVKKSDVINDQSGGIGLRTRQLANVAARHADKLLIGALVDGTTNLGYDGIAMFSDTHTARDVEGDQDNLLAGAGTSTANVATDINQIFTYFGNVVSENDEPYFGEMEVGEVTIVAPWAMRKAFMEALGATIIANTTNVQVDGVKIKLILSGRLYTKSADANDWYALVTDAPLRPLIYQVREGVQYAAQENNGSDDVFDRHVYKYKATAFHQVGYGPWQAACKVVNT